jgi:hypothetical protein
LNHPVPFADGQPGLTTWVANIFMTHFFGWLGSPTDVDGDGRITLVDAYRYAGAASNNQLKEAKVVLFEEAQRVSAALKSARAKVVATPVDIAAKKAEVDAHQEKLQQVLGSLYLHQEPWVLNANVARDVEF